MTGNFNEKFYLNKDCSWNGDENKLNEEFISMYISRDTHMHGEGEGCSYFVWKCKLKVMHELQGSISVEIRRRHAKC